LADAGSAFPVRVEEEGGVKPFPFYEILSEIQKSIALHYRTSRCGGRHVLVENLIRIRNQDTVTDTDLAFSEESTTVIYNKEYSLIHEDAPLV